MNLTKQGIKDLSDLGVKQTPKIISEPVTESYSSNSPKLVTLYVSYNCGVSYTVVGYNTEKALKAKTEEFDYDGLRWYTEDWQNNVQNVSKIHKNIIDLVKHLASVEA